MVLRERVQTPLQAQYRYHHIDGNARIVARANDHWIQQLQSQQQQQDVANLHQQQKKSHTADSDTAGGQVRAGPFSLPFFI